jgi:hypothetical protein
LVTGIDAIWCLTVQSLVSSHSIVKPNVLRQTGSGLRGCLIGVELDFFVFDGSPEALNDHVVSPTAFAVHADLDLVVFQ